MTIELFPNSSPGGAPPGPGPSGVLPSSTIPRRQSNLTSIVGTTAYVSWRSPLAYRNVTNQNSGSLVEPSSGDMIAEIPLGSSISVINIYVRFIFSLTASSNVVFRLHQNGAAIIHDDMEINTYVNTSGYLSPYVLRLKNVTVTAGDNFRISAQVSGAMSLPATTETSIANGSYCQVEEVS